MARKVTVLECAGCGEEFEARRNDAKWCSECRSWSRKRTRADYETARKSPCPDCGNLKARKALRCRVCSNRLRGEQQRGENSPTWKGGRTRHSDGYIELRIDGKKVLEHRKVWEDAHGPLPHGWVVHHLNGKKDDNRLENLVGMSRGAHGPREHIDPTEYERRIRFLEAELARAISL